MGLVLVTIRLRIICLNHDAPDYQNRKDAQIQNLYQVSVILTCIRAAECRKVHYRSRHNRQAKPKNRNGSLCLFTILNML